MAVLIQHGLITLSSFFKYNRHSASFSGFKLFFLRSSLANLQTHRVLPLKFFSSNVRIAKPAGSTARHTPD
jgi:hypothetical protein